MLARLDVSDGNLEHFDALRDRILDFGVDELHSETILLPVVEGQVRFLFQKAARLDAVHDPVACEHIAPEVVRLGHFIADWSDLISEALVELTDEASVLLDQDAQMSVFSALRQEEDHGHLLENWQILREDGLSAHFLTDFFFY